MNILEGSLNAEKQTVAVVASRWNPLVTDRLLEGARSFFLRQGGREENLTVARVPGSAELPLAVKRLAATGRFQGLVALGAVIRGETSHHEAVTRFALGGLASIGLEFDLPIGLGVLTADTFEQALDRAGGKRGNKGEEAVAAVIESINLLHAIPL